MTYWFYLYIAWFFAARLHRAAVPRGRAGDLAVRRVAPYVAHAALWVLLTTTGPFADIAVNDFYVYTGYADLLRSGALPVPRLRVRVPAARARADARHAVGVGRGRDRARDARSCALFLRGAARGRSAASARRGLLVAQPILIGAFLRTHFDAARRPRSCSRALALVVRRPAGLGTGAARRWRR